MNTININELEKKVAGLWDNILANSKFIAEIMSDNATNELYTIYMIETYHYTKHNARNQALVGVIGKDVSSQYTAYCFRHANEETGHENMALNDIESLGFNTGPVSAMRPLAATETLIAYLYWISATGNPVQRLGYSFWAENVYSYIDAVLKKLQSTLNLTEKNLSFFIAHSSIDEKHAKDVEDMLKHVCHSQQDVDDVCAVMENSLILTGRILDDVWGEYVKFKSGESDRYGFLRSKV